MLLKTSNALRYATTLGNKIVIHSRQTIHMCCLYVLDPEPMTVILHLGLDVMKMYISTRTEVYMSKLSGQTDRHVSTLHLPMVMIIFRRRHQQPTKFWLTVGCR